ncbi:MAG: hypothetical protein ACLP2J_05290 [Acidimicrobiales bacterium]|jgi:hypothetical protein
MKAEGWYVDPYGLHDARWFSDGSPTALVHDGGVESQDPPPDTPYTGQLQRPAEPASTDGDDLRRADSAESKRFDPETEEDAAWEAFDQSSGGD